MKTVWMVERHDDLDQEFIEGIYTTKEGALDYVNNYSKHQAMTQKSGYLRDKLQTLCFEFLSHNNMDGEVWRESYWFFIIEMELKE